MAIKVAVDAGHGSTTVGKRTPDGYREHWINVKTAYYLTRALEANGIEVFKSAWNDLNAEDDADISLTQRQKNIKAQGCQYSISCHANAYGSGWNNANGIETLISNKDSAVGDSRAMAEKIQNKLIGGTKQTNRGVKRQALSMCNCTAMGTKAAVLVEIGFMTNKVEAQLMQTDDFCKECGEEIAHGFCNYLGISYKAPGENVTPAQPAPQYTALQEKGISYAKDFVGYKILKATLPEIKAQVLQEGINRDYKAGLAVDGKFGPKSTNALGTHYVQKGEEQFMVTAAEILMYLNDLDPNGVETPGHYGNGLTKAAKKKFGGLGTKITAGNFKTLIL